MSEIKSDQILEMSMETNFWTWSAQKNVKPIPVTRAEGVYFWDVNDKRYLDFNSTVMCVNIGHGNKKVIQAMCDQAKELTFAGPQMATRPRALLGKLLKEIVPDNLTRFLYTLGGADANENAIKLARAFTGRPKILTRYRSYHGATAGAIALTGDPRRTAWEPLTMPGVVHFLDPYQYRSTFHRTNPSISEEELALDYLNHLEEIIKYEDPSKIAAVMIEPVTGTNGIIIPPKGYIQGLRKLCDRYEILLIADEVMTGFGRTGKWFALEHWDVKPDIMTMAKGLTSAYAPLGAVAMKEKIAARFDHEAYQGGLTFNGHPVSMAAAIANIEVIRENKLVENSTAMGAQLADILAELKSRHASIGDVRSIGLFGGIELVRNRETREPMAPFNEKSAEMSKLREQLLEKGLFLYTHWNILLIVPPLIINEQELNEGLSIIDQALEITDSVVVT
ncbi:MAG: aminotransferase class III-fold pyridoxal phosphate-dependent enzyme [Anaerolineaceae bacterium]|nr:aminotransferase class III-fold pyridoxal phosphate-dependent enzyme [Anaerolineaceae bacterium]